MPPVVFFPGTLCDERLWMPVWRQMEIDDRRYVPLQWAETLEQMQGLTEHAIENQPCHLVGFSMGGYIAALHAITNPQHVASLTLISFSCFGLSDEELSKRQQIIKALEQGQFRPMNKQRLQQFVGSTSETSDFARQTVRDMEADLGGSVLKYHMIATSNRKDLIQPLRAANFPVNIIAAKHDLIAPYEQLYLAHQKLDGSRFFSIENSGHMSPLEQAAQLAEYLTQIICPK
ncbi:alpha/beta fold hydrolase [Neptunicella marina]|uniref:Alpha/beta hydrolase n=1 Tax=Neptunicella marina TaxID=2125989 RepID=A0A8J6M2C0_9ALTE|nr:alpha/beta hydrolase [Neptunicella marina]MBC3766133.1 alpha/beta hydrolase [Neptunicella marina]